MKILIVKLSSFGDQIHLCPAVSDLAKAHPDATIHWVVQVEYANIALLHSKVSRVFGLPISRLGSHILDLKSWRSFYLTVREIRDQGYDLVIDAQGLLKSAIISGLSRGRQIVGYSKKSVSELGANWFYSRTFDPRRGISAVQRNRELIAYSIGIIPDRVVDYGLELAPFGGQRPAAKTLMIAPFASTPKKQWTELYWKSVLDHLVKEFDQIFLVWGSNSEYESAKHLVEGSGVSVQPLSQRYEFSELALRLKEATLVIGVDTGVTHFANALGIPTVAIFTTTKPELFFCPGGSFSTAIGGGVGDPAPEDVVAAASRVLTALSSPI